MVRELEKHKVRGRESRKVENGAEQAWALNTVIFHGYLCSVVKQEQLTVLLLHEVYTSDLCANFTGRAEK